jgi:aryl sulfotransferase
VTGKTVWLASYPKSGNTWLRAVLTAWLEEGEIDLGELVGWPIASSREVFDAAVGIPSSTLTAAEVELLRPRVDEVVAAVADAPLMRKIHDAFLLGPAGEPVVSTAATRAAVYVIRDPRDVAVSYARARSRSFESAAARLADPGLALAAEPDRLHEQLPQRLGTWSSHVRSWTEQTAFPVEVVRYEDFTAAPAETFGRVLAFVGFDVVEERRLARAIERASFERLRAVELARGFRERPPGERDFFRRGEPGAWRDELPAAVAARIERDHADVMSHFGYS